MLDAAVGAEAGVVSMDDDSVGADDSVVELSYVEVSRAVAVVAMRVGRVSSARYAGVLSSFRLWRFRFGRIVDGVFGVLRSWLRLRIRRRGLLGFRLWLEFWLRWIFRLVGWFWRLWFCC